MKAQSRQLAKCSKMQRLGFGKLGLGGNSIRTTLRKKPLSANTGMHCAEEHLQLRY